MVDSVAIRKSVVNCFVEFSVNTSSRLKKKCVARHDYHVLLFSQYHIWGNICTEKVLSDVSVCEFVLFKRASKTGTTSVSTTVIEV